MKSLTYFFKDSTFAILLMFICIVAGNAMAVSIDDFDKALPPEIDGWKKAGSPVTYDNKSLYDYINGGAELYIAYNFQKMYAFRYTVGDDSEIIIDIFDMGKSYDAFGIFSHGREEDDKKLGQGSEYNSGLLTFWKDRYYVSILAFPETESKAQTVKKLGAMLADVIPGTGEMPPIVDLLPAENLVPYSTHYFHHYILVNSHYYIANENILNIDGTTHAVLARYRIEGNTFYMLLVDYENTQKAKEAQKSFLQHSLPDAQEGIKELDDGKWTGCKLKDKLLVVIFNSPTKDVLISYLELVKPKCP
jgi:hypothetical protein